MEKTDKKPKNTTERAAFSSKLGYVLATAGSAVGLGNIWRFPYLTAKYGGGIFLLVYLILMVTFGYALMVSETALGRMTGKSPIGAFESFGSTLPFKLAGRINAAIPMLILSYYCVIGGWVAKYLYEYIIGGTEAAAADGYFNGFIASGVGVEFWFVIFGIMVMSVIIMGVNKGIERVSVFMMPVLIVLAVFISLYSVTRPGAIEGVKYMFVPNFDHFSMMTVVAAMGQMFYSLSIAMGILYTYGSYLGKDVDIERSTKQVEVFDTAIAVLSGLMIIPAVFAFSGGGDTLQSGPSLMFVTIPKVFASMGFGRAAGILFFMLVLFAALTSAISLAEVVVSTFRDQLGWGRVKSTAVTSAVMLVLGTFSALGFNALDFVSILGMSVLDFLDFLTNSVMMPVAAIATCILVVRVAGIDRVAEEIEISSQFKRRKMYTWFMKYLSVACMAVILVSSIANAFGWIKM